MFMFLCFSGWREKCSKGQKRNTQNKSIFNCLISKRINLAESRKQNKNLDMISRKEVKEKQITSSTLMIPTPELSFFLSTFILLFYILPNKPNKQIIKHKLSSISEIFHLFIMCFLVVLKKKAKKWKSIWNVLEVNLLFNDYIVRRGCETVFFSVFFCFQNFFRNWFNLF